MFGYRAMLGGVLLALGLWGCASDLNDSPVPADRIWTEPPTVARPLRQIPFMDREQGHTYGLPRTGETSIADLIAMFPTEPVGFAESDIFLAPGTDIPTDQCRGGQPAVVAELPVTIEAVVTLYPRQYLKLPVCGQDERHYGSYTVEDDTGGILVLRDSRVAPFSFADRVRLTVHGLMLTFGPEPDTRAVLVADVEALARPADAAVLYESQVSPLSSADVGRVHRVEGYVVEPPISQNFNQLVLADRPLPIQAARAEPADVELDCRLVCEGACLGTACGAAPLLCEPLCNTLCSEAPTGEVVTRQGLPVCWIAGLSAELGRRGVYYEYGEHLRVTGPVVNNFDVQILVEDTAQVETLP